MNRVPALMVIPFSMILSGCLGPSVSGSGHVVTDKRNVSGFSSVSLEGSGHLVVEQGAAESLTVTADDNLMPYLQAEVRGGTLALGEKPGANLNPSKDIVFNVTLANLDGLTLSGSGEVQAKGIQSPKMKIDLSGSGDISAQGSADDFGVSISGSGNFHGDGLKSKRTKVDISGSGNAAVASSDTLDATINGSGSIEYVGSPQVRQNINGSGSVRRR